MNSEVPFYNVDINTIIEFTAAEPPPGMLYSGGDGPGQAIAMNPSIGVAVADNRAKTRELERQFPMLERRDRATEITAIAVHEPGHAVMAALCGFKVKCLGIGHEEGAMDIGGRSPTWLELPEGVGGACCVDDDSLIGDLVSWDSWDGERFIVDREEFALRLSKLSPEERKEELRKARGLLAIALAGPISEQLFEFDYYEEGCIEVSTDLARASCIAGLIDPKEVHGCAGEEEVQRMVKWVEEILRGNWLHIHRLANALANEGLLEGGRLNDLLPSRLGGWFGGKWRSFPPARKGRPASK